MSRSDRITVAAAGGALVMAAAAAWVLLGPTVGDGFPEGAPLLVGSPVAPQLSPSAATHGGTIVVDVQGAVARPGVRELPAGSRIADAISAAGGYGPAADLAAAAATVNLAQPLTDGQQIRVPGIGEAPATAPTTASGSTAGGGGPVDLNTATPEELEALPGIGPVTVQKIVAARQEQPFTSLEDAVTRGVLNRGQLEEIQGIATAG